MKALVTLITLTTVIAPGFETLSVFREGVKIDPRIYNGSEAIPHSFPYQVALMLDTSYGAPFCGGSLISPDYVLTAAHCLHDAYQVTVVLGAHVFLKNESTQVSMTLSARSFIVHSGYNPDAFYHDIALIRLPRSVEYTNEIAPINLPRRSDTYKTYEGQTATTCGWGLLSDDGFFGFALQYADFKILPYATCRKVYEHILLTSFVCIDASNGKNICGGDSGGPLVVTENDGSKTLIGITAFGNESCEDGSPSAFTRTASYLDWISRNTGIPIKL